MTTLKVPKAVVDNDYQAFPEGLFKGKFAFVKDDSRGEQGSDDWRFGLRVAFTGLAPAVDGGPDVGARPFSGTIGVIRDGANLLEITSQEEIDALSFPLQRGLMLLTQLAVVVGAASRDAKGNVAVDLDTFVEDVRAHKYDGRNAGVEVTHWFPNGSDSAQDQIGTIFSTSA